jgi:hypothetical protein
MLSRTFRYDSGRPERWGYRLRPFIEFDNINFSKSRSFDPTKNGFLGDSVWDRSYIGDSEIKKKLKKLSIEMVAYDDHAECSFCYDNRSKKFRAAIQYLCENGFIPGMVI